MLSYRRDHPLCQNQLPGKMKLQSGKLTAILIQKETYDVKLCVENDSRGRAVRVAKRAKGGRPCTGTGAAEEGAQQA